MIAASMACAGFIGPAFLTSPPPKYSLHRSVVVELGGDALDRSASLMMSRGPLKSASEKVCGASREV